MRLSTCTIKKSCKIFLCISFLCIVILSNYVFLSIFHVTAQPNSDYDENIELEYGIPTKLSEISVPSSNNFESYAITGFAIYTNFSNNTGSIWINDIDNETVWSEQLNETIEVYVNATDTSIRQYSLWVNSSTLGNNTLYFTFRPDIFHAGNFGLIILIVSIPFIIIIAVVIGLVKKKQSRSVRFAIKVGERMSTKYQERMGKILNRKNKNVVLKLCPKCGFKIKKQDDKYCTKCGFTLKEDSKPE